MGVDYDAILMVGKKMENVEAVEEFLRKYLTFTEEEETKIDEDGIQEFLYGNEKFGVCIDTTNAYIEDPYAVVGIEISSGEVDKSIADILQAKDKWLKLFPDTIPELVLEGKVW